jgi:hypothetical protein
MIVRFPLARRSIFLALLLATLVACQSASPTVSLTVDIVGAGSGSVTSAPAGINTQANTTRGSFAVGTEVELTAVAAAGSVFVGYSFPSGATYQCEDGGPTEPSCVLTMDMAKSVTATFQPQVGPARLNVVVDPSLGGSVTSSPAGISACTDECQAEFPVGTQVQLTATVTSEPFTSWSGDACQGETGLVCTLTIGSGITTVTANFGGASTNVYSAMARSLGALLIHNQEVDGATWLDESGAERHGSFVGTPTWVANGGPAPNVAGYFSFDGVGQAINVGNHAALDIAGPHTLVWWERNDGATQAGNHRVKIAKGINSYRAQVRDMDSTRLRYNVVDSGDSSNRTVATATGAAPADTWQMWAHRFTGTHLEIWEVVGGVAILRANLAYTGTPATSPTERFGYGALSTEDSATWTFHWRGHLAGALTFGASLSAANLEALHAAAFE